MLTRSRVIVGATLVGLAVLTLVLLAESLNAEGTAQIVGFQHTGDARKVVVIVGIGVLTEIAERDVKEDPTTVRITVRTRVPRGAIVPAILVYVPVTVSLASALGDRAVLDQNAAPVRDLGMYELPGRTTGPP